MQDMYFQKLYSNLMLDMLLKYNTINSHFCVKHHLNLPIFFGGAATFTLHRALFTDIFMR